MSECIDKNSVLRSESYCSETSSAVPFGSTKSEASGSSGYISSSPPSPTSPISISPPQTLKRSRSSSFRLINRRISTASNCSQPSLSREPGEDKLASVIGWYPSFLLKVYLELFSICFCVLFKKLPIIIPTLWLSACLWCFTKSINFALSILKNMLVRILLPASMRNTQRRTVLISGGSTVQAIHLARNFSLTGARVIVCEVEGLFSLARFSTAVDKYYTIPRPKDEQFTKYIDALKDIVVRENVKYFIPVSETNSAYYDALAKPHIEVLGCQCICPEVREILLLNDLLELMRKIQSDGLPTPNHYPITSNVELNRFYDFGMMKKEAHFMVNTGMEGCKHRIRVDLPNTRRKLKFNHCISEQNPWLVVQDCQGEKFVTCTTIRDSQVVCNVTCKIDEMAGVMPIEKPEIEQWLIQFFAGLKAHRKIIGHFSFYLTIPETGTILPTDCQVGVRLPYICYTSVQSRIVWKPCRHFSRHTSGPIVTENGKYWLHQMVLAILEHPSIYRIAQFLQIMWGRKDALFVVWDPLPYCAYYYLQLPLYMVYTVLGKVNGHVVR